MARLPKQEAVRANLERLREQLRKEKQTALWQENANLPKPRKATSHVRPAKPRTQAVKQETQKPLATAVPRKRLELSTDKRKAIEEQVDALHSNTYSDKQLSAIIASRTGVNVGLVEIVVREKRRWRFK